MEQQKVLWIVFSVTLFLVVVVVVGFVWFLPSDKETEPGEFAAGAEPSDRVFDPIVWVRDDEEVPGITEETGTGEGAKEMEGDLLLVYGEAETTADVSQGGPVSEVKATGVRVVEAVPAATGTAVTAPGVTMTTSLPAAVSSAVAATQVKSGAAGAVVAETRSVAAASRAPATEQVTQYWIQAGSFKSQSRAELTQAQLAEKGWNTRIISRDVGGKIYFRVRLGPFDTEGEAGKFLSWITDIDSFESSYISQVYTTRAIN